MRLGKWNANHEFEDMNHTRTNQKRGKLEEMEEYNYETFPLTMSANEFKDFPDFLHVGQKAPDGDLVDVATGRTGRLSDYWSEGPLVVEFGSIT